MVDIQCCKCGEWTYRAETLTEAATVISRFTKTASESCDNCGHDFCNDCKYMESEIK